MNEWDSHMSDFVPADLVSFEIYASSNFSFFEHVDVVPTKIRGAYFVSHTSNSEISLEVKSIFFINFFKIIDPDDNLIF